MALLDDIVVTGYTPSYYASYRGTYASKFADNHGLVFVTEREDGRYDIKSPTTGARAICTGKSLFPIIVVGGFSSYCSICHGDNFRNTFDQDGSGSYTSCIDCDKDFVAAIGNYKAAAYEEGWYNDAATDWYGQPLIRLPKVSRSLF